MKIDIGLIRPSPYQPRLGFNLEDLRGSIQRDGILVNLTVRKVGDYYELVDGERRWRLAKELGFKTVPCDVVSIDDEAARRLVWKVNTLRKEYGTEEKARYFKTLQEKFGMSVRGIARECDYGPQTVQDYLNVFKLPDFYQKMVWDGRIGIGHLRELSQMFNGGVSYETHITHWLDQVLEKRLTGPELRQTISPEIKELTEKRVEAAKEAIKEAAPTPEVRMETPEDLERAARALRQEATRRREEAMTPEEKAMIEVEKERKREEIRRKGEEARRRREEEEGRRIQEEAERRVRELTEAGGRRIEEETRTRVREELMRDEAFLRQAAKTAAEERFPLEREVPGKMISEIDVGDIKCPKCGVALHLIHCEPGGAHKVEEKIT